MKDDAPERGVGEVASGRLLMFMGSGAVVFVLSLALMLGLYTWLANGPQVAQTPTPTPGPQLNTALFRTEDVPPQTPPAKPTALPDHFPIAQAMQTIAAKGSHGFDPLDGPPPRPAQ